MTPAIAQLDTEDGGFIDTDALQRVLGYKAQQRGQVLVLLNRGEFPDAIKRGRAWLIPRADVVAYLKKLSDETKAKLAKNKSKIEQKRRERELARAGRDASGASSGAGATA